MVKSVEQTSLEPFVAVVVVVVVIDEAKIVEEDVVAGFAVDL